jgi:hypothetical protein
MKSKTVKAIDEVMQQISSDPTLIASLIAALSDKSTARLKAANKLQLVSQVNPGVLYPHFEVFANLLGSSSSVLLWNSIIILSHLVKVDTGRLFDNVIDKYYAHLWDGKLVTAANILGSSGRIARCRPDLTGRVTFELLKVDEIPLPTAECREVARGHVLASLAEYINIQKIDQPVHEFIVRCSASHRPAVKKKAEELLTSLHQA